MSSEPRTVMPFEITKPGAILPGSRDWRPVPAEMAHPSTRDPEMAGPAQGRSSAPADVDTETERPRERLTIGQLMGRARPVAPVADDPGPSGYQHHPSMRTMLEADFEETKSALDSDSDDDDDENTL